MVGGVLLIVVRRSAGEQSCYINNNETLKYSQIAFLLFNRIYWENSMTPNSTVTAVESLISHIHSSFTFSSAFASSHVTPHFIYGAELQAVSSGCAFSICEIEVGLSPIIIFGFVITAKV